jgi:hypothetical protein
MGSDSISIIAYERCGPIIQLSPINHFAASAALVKVPFPRFAQLVKVSGIHFS